MSQFEEVSQLFADYAWYTDMRDVGGIGSLYADDGEMTITIAGGGAVGPYAGRQAIVDFIDSAMEGLTDQRRHVITNVRIATSSEDAVTATAFLTLIITENGDLRVQTTGVYSVEAVRDTDGLKIEQMSLHLDRQY